MTDPHHTGPFPKIRGTQVGLRDPASVDRIKADMREGRYRFEEVRGQLSGVRDTEGVYYVYVGHHRVVAALEILTETGDATFLLRLLEYGKWDDVTYVPNTSRPLPSRSWWGRIRNLLGI